MQIMKENSERQKQRKIDYIPCLYNVVVARKTRESRDGVIEEKRRKGIDSKETRILKRESELLFVGICRKISSGETSKVLLLCCSKTSYLCTQNTTLSERDVTLRVVVFLFYSFLSFRILVFF
jgi:hypothetical protein